MRELSCVAENLRLVQNAKRQFLRLWAVEYGCIDPMLDRMAEDLLQLGSSGMADDGVFDPPVPPGEVN